MTAMQAQRERVDRLRISVDETIRTTRVLLEESKALLAKIAQRRSRYKPN